MSEVLRRGLPLVQLDLTEGLLLAASLAWRPLTRHWASGKQVIKHGVCLIRVSKGRARARWAHAVGVARARGGVWEQQGRWRPPTSAPRDRLFHYTHLHPYLYCSVVAIL